MLRRFAYCCSSLLLLASAATLAAQPIHQFSAETRTTSAQGSSGAGKLFVDGNKIRAEANHGGLDTIMIVDQNKKNIYRLMPPQKMYAEISFADAAAAHRTPEWRMYDPSNPCSDRPDTSCKKAGTESINGFSCNKWLLTGKHTSTLWIDQKTGITVKTLSANGTVFEILNIKQGSQDQKLFAIPAGYTKKTD